MLSDSSFEFQMHWSRKLVGELVLKSWFSSLSKSRNRCLSSSFAKNLFFGYLLKHLFKKSFPSDDKNFEISGVCLKNAIWYNNEAELLKLVYAEPPVDISIIVHPNTHISARKPCSFPRTASGDMNIGVPQIITPSTCLEHLKLPIWHQYYITKCCDP